MSDTTLEKIATKEHEARSCLAENWSINTKFMLFAVGAVGCALADWAILYGFFVEAHQNHVGELTTEGMLAALLGSSPAVAVAYATKECFLVLPKWVRSVVIVGVCILGLFVSFNLGKVQASIILKSALANVFPEESQQINPQLESLLEMDNSMQTIEKKNNDEISPESAAMLKKDSFINSFMWYGYAFILMAFVGAFCLLALRKIDKKKGLVKYAADTVKACEKLAALQRSYNACIMRAKELDDNTPRLCRAAQDIAVSAYQSGLARIAGLLGLIKIFAVENKHAYAKFSFFQVRLLKPITFLNIGITQEMIEAAHESINELNFIDPDEPMDKSDSASSEAPKLESV